MAQNVRFEERETTRTTVNNGGGQGGGDRGGQGGGYDRGYDRGQGGGQGGGNGGGNGGGGGGRGAPPQAPQQRSGEKDDFVHKVGDAITKGGSPDGYLAWYLKKLREDPLRTKMLTSGSLAALQEFLASWIAKDRNKHGHYFTSRVPKMAVYGAFISAPLGHVMINILQRLFAGRTSLKAKILQIIVSNLIVSPIQNAVYLTSMAVIAGARTFHQIRATVRAGFMPVMKVSWITSPLALAFAQAFLPNELWVPFFNFVGFVIGTYINAHTKKKRLQALRRKYQDQRDMRDMEGRSEYDRRGDGRSEYDRKGPGGY